MILHLTPMGGILYFKPNGRVLLSQAQGRHTLFIDLDAGGVSLSKRHFAKQALWIQPLDPFFQIQHYIQADHRLSPG